MKKHLFPSLIALLTFALISCDGSDPISLGEDLIDEIEDIDDKLENAFDDLVDDAEDIIDGGEEEIREARLTEIVLVNNASRTFTSPPDGGFPYDQETIPLLPNATKYRVTFDFIGQNLEDSDHDFAVIYDTPQVRTFSIYNPVVDGFDVFIPFSSTLTNFLEYQDIFYQVEHDIDLEKNSWTIRINGELFYDGVFNASTIEDIRFSFGGFDDERDLSRTATVENLTIKAYIPNNLPL